MPGPGKISELKFGPQARGALLYNFEIGSSELKIEHVHWIQSTLKVLVDLPGAADPVIVGLASRTGKESYNMRLSEARAKSVSHRLFLSGPPKMPTEVLTYVGEKAAALAGVKDGTEHERFRAVWVYVGEAAQPVYEPPPIVYVERRTRVVIMLKSEMTGAAVDPEERVFQGAMALRRVWNSKDPNSGIVSEQKMHFDSSFDLIGITVETKTQVDGIPIIVQHEMTYLEVIYEWGPRDYRSRHVRFTRKNLRQSRGGFKDETTSINIPMAEEWLKRPHYSYEYGIW